MADINRPDWVNAREYTRTLNAPPVQQPIVEELSKKYDPTKHDGLRNGTAYNDAKTFLPSLMNDLRYFDIKSKPYWRVSLCGSLLFFLTEAFILYNFSYSESKDIIGLCLLLAFLIGLCLFLLLYINETKSIPKFLRKINVSTLYIIPVGLISLGMLGINLLLVSNSGWSSSPFMPALIFVSLSIIGAPRENSRTIYWLTLFAVLSVAYPYYHSFNDETVAIFPNSKLSFYINVITFIFTTGMILLLRSYSSQKIC
ncbi:MAG: hypothetical protein IPL84_05440 [Chitinophagaceae bacterium]|nr:hypothetical protein [Chitinophagaceae bacterium]